MFATVKFQRTKKDENGIEAYLWYRATAKDWRLTPGSDFQARNTKCWMYIDSQGKQDLWIHLQWVFIFFIHYIKKLLRVWCKENWNQVARIHWRWMEGSRDDHDILNFTGEKGPYFWSGKPFLQSQSRDETYSTSSTMTILKPRVNPLKKISIKQWRPVRIDIYYLSCFNRCHSWILTISLLCHHLSVSYGHWQPVYVQIPVKSPDTLWMMKNNIYCTLIRCNLSVQ